MTERSSQHAQFWSKVAEKYDSVVDLQIGPNTRTLARVRLQREASLGHAVEFGCGTGFNTEVLAARSARLVATDLAPGMLAIAKRNIKALNVMFQQEDCEQTSFPDSAFDTAFLGLVLHFTDPPRALAEMHRILKPGGALIIYNPDPHPLQGWDRWRWLARGYFYGITRYRTRPPKGLLKQVLSKQQLCDLLATSGFKVLSTESIRNSSVSYNIPIEYVKAEKIGLSEMPEGRTELVHAATWEPGDGENSQSAPTES